MFDSKRFLRDYNFTFDTEGKNWSAGFVQIRCPFCSDHSNHLGMPINGAIPNCWRCGPHSIEKIIKELLHVNYHEAKEIAKEYSLSLSEKTLTDKYSKKSRKDQDHKALSLPAGSASLLPIHKKYLKSRGFNNIERLENEWGIKGTSHFGDYKFRIVIPIFVDGKIISYQCRDVTGKSDLRYKACKIDDEIIHHKFIVYGIDNIRNRMAIAVEGILDAWKIGPGAVATFGTGFTKEQVIFIAERIDKLFILYDIEKEAQEKAKKFAGLLSECGVDVEIITQDEYEDPGSMPESVAESLRINLLRY